MKALFPAILFLLVIATPSHANNLDKAIAIAALKGIAHVVTNYPIIVSAIAILLFRKQIFELLSDNEVTRLIGEYPIISLAVGLAALKVVLCVIGSS